MKLYKFIVESINAYQNELKKLDTDILVVTFIKKNGEKRLMKCTRNLKYVPANMHPNGNRCS